MLLEPPGGAHLQVAASPRPGRSCASANSRTGAPSEYQPAVWPWSSTKRPRRASEPRISAGRSTPSASHSSGVKRSSGATMRTSSSTPGGSWAKTSEARYAKSGPPGRRMPLERLPAARGRHTAQGLDREPDRRRPAARRAMELGRGLARRRRRSAPPAARRSPRRRTRGPTPLSSSTWPWPRSRSIGNGRLGARREDDVESRRRLPAERLDQLHRARRPGQLVDVVDDEHEVAAKLCLQRLADERRDAPRACLLVRLRVGACSADDRAGDLRRDARHAESKSVDDAAREDRERLVLGRGAVPGAVDVRRPRRRAASTSRSPRRRRRSSGGARALRRDARRDGRGRAATQGRPAAAASSSPSR